MARIISTPAIVPQIKPAALRTFHAQLAAWYKTNGRHALPWRQTDDPYHIWLSEVMLQQTQVATVRARFYGPFLKKFPSVAALAAAEQAEVMKAWEGLGYYSRARNLHAAAKQLIIEGGLPPGVYPRAGGGPSSKNTDPRRTRLAQSATQCLIDRLMALPGIGKNTARAIAAFAYHQPVAILEANVKRVVARIFALTTPSDAELWAGADALLNQAHPFDYNQAMMDLGSLICTPKKPDCTACPASTLCAGKSAPETFPTPKVKKQVPTRHVTIHVHEDSNGRLFLEKRDEALLGGLYGFTQSNHTAKKSIGSVTHIYSHFKLIGTVIHEHLPAKTNSADWYTRAQIAALPLSKLDHKVLALVENGHSRRHKKAKAAPRKRKD
jgi:A/G-specific adenine glycosylase